MKSRVRKCYIFLCTIDFEVTWPFSKMWSDTCWIFDGLLCHWWHLLRGFIKSTLLLDTKRYPWCHFTDTTLRRWIYESFLRIKDVPRDPVWGSSSSLPAPFWQLMMSLVDSWLVFCVSWKIELMIQLASLFPYLIKNHEVFPTAPIKRNGFGTLGPILLHFCSHAGRGQKGRSCACVST